MQVTDAQIQRLDSLTKEALQLIVVQEPARGFEVLRTAQKLIDDSVTELNRTTSLASDVRHEVENGIERVTYIPEQRRFDTPILMQHGMWHGAWCWEESRIGKLTPLLTKW